MAALIARLRRTVEHRLGGGEGGGFTARLASCPPPPPPPPPAPKPGPPPALGRQRGGAPSSAAGRRARQRDLARPCVCPAGAPPAARGNPHQGRKRTKGGGRGGVRWEARAAPGRPRLSRYICRSNGARGPAVPAEVSEFGLSPFHPPPPHHTPKTPLRRLLAVTPPLPRGAPSPPAPPHGRVTASTGWRGPTWTPQRKNRRRRQRPGRRGVRARPHPRSGRVGPGGRPPPRPPPSPPALPPSLPPRGRKLLPQISSF